MVASIGVVASPSQGVSYYQRDGYYAKDDPAHLEASAWAGKGAEALGLSGPVDPDTFQAILEGKVPDGPHLGKRGKDGEIEHRPGRDVTMSAPKSVSFVAMVGGDERIVEAHDRAVRTTLGWIEKNAVQTRIQDGTTGAMVHAGDQKTVVATFRHDTSRNLDPQLHTHCVIANMAQGADNRWRTMVNDGLYRQQKAISAIYRAELAEGLAVSATRWSARTRTAASRSPAFRARSSRRDEGTGLRRPLRQQAPGGSGRAHDADGEARRGQGSVAPGLGPPSSTARVLARADHGPGLGARARDLDLGAGKPGGIARRRGILRDRRGELGGGAPVRASGGVLSCRSSGGRRFRRSRARPRCGRRSV